MASKSRQLIASLSSRIRGVIFDMDGTLTRPGAIDFARMRERCGIKPGGDIIEFVNNQSEPLRSKLNEILIEEEEFGLKRMELMPDIKQLFDYLIENNINRALLTRNNDTIMNRTVELMNYAKQEPFSVMLSRTFSPPKPHPDAIHHICQRWKLNVNEVLMVGDSLDDIKAGAAAGTKTVLIGLEDNHLYQQALPHADFVIKNLFELINVIENINNNAPESHSSTTTAETIIVQSEEENKPSIENRS
ncbi:unnamed protein product [Didymodactylos carnosus]|uniref:Uncharacterized protein n=1 Tax=Didymodactylos carnosus TaxID=1234261 RepID=A0A813Y665_9BILA|nr:unnamed protein product [Didymodactylos carnosus]CAF0878945.1 unnamed protein product [Didymodactylos carnosus]CAF3493971.1 unnamed protein product [Didymodactylos carnosus]CAF3665471.1 unnamed protein product [Didymodactylos carnosus]